MFIDLTDLQGADLCAPASEPPDPGSWPPFAVVARYLADIGQTRADFWTAHPAEEKPRPVQYDGPEGLRLNDYGDDWGPGKTWFKRFGLYWTYDGLTIAGHGDDRAQAERDWQRAAAEERAKLLRRLDALAAAEAALGAEQVKKGGGGDG